jgi:hypothetical protein
MILWALAIPVLVLVAYLLFDLAPGQHWTCGCARCHYLRQHREPK